MGDIVAFGDSQRPEDGYGNQRPGQQHIGIYLGHGLYISVTTSPAPGQTEPIKIKFQVEDLRRVYRSVD